MTTPPTRFVANIGPDGTWRRVMDLPVPVNPPPPTGHPYPKVASVPYDVSSGYVPGETSWDQAVRRALTYGFNGAVFYTPGNPAWSTELAALAASPVGSQDFYLQYTYKGVAGAGFDAILANLPPKWRPLFVANHFQEPEDNIFGTASKVPNYTAAAYKNEYANAAARIRAWNAAHPGLEVQLPWVEWQEWTTDPNNTNGWLPRMGEITPAAADFAGILWSVYEYGQTANNPTKFAPPTDRIDAMINRLKALRDTVAPSKPMAWMAGGYTLEPGPTPPTLPAFPDASKQAQAAWLTKSFTNFRNAGFTGWAWWNVNFPGTGGPNGDARVELNSFAINALRDLPN